MFRRLSPAAFALAFAALPASAQISPPPGGSGGGSGTVTSVATTCPTSSNSPSSGVVTLAGGLGVVSRSASGDTITTADCGKEIHYTASGTVTSLSPSALGAQFTVNVMVDSGAGGPAILSTSSGVFTNNGTSSLSIGPGQTASLTSDGTNIIANVAASGGSSPGGSNNEVQINSSGSLGGGGVVVSGAPTASLGSLQTRPNFITNYWYLTPSNTYGGAGGAQAASLVYCQSFALSPPGMDIKSLAAYVTAGSGNISYALFYSSAGRPGALIDYAGPVAFSGAGSAAASMHNTHDLLQAGSYWLCQTEDSTGTINAWANSGPMQAWAIGAASVPTGATSVAAGIACAAASACGGSYAAWSAGAFTWSSLSSATWSPATSNLIGQIFLQAN